jgi:Protein of unknown function (DUF2752)
LGPKDYKILNTIFIGILILMFGYAFFFAYDSHSVACVYVKTYGIPCPTCGITRAFSEILHLRFKHAIQLNILSIYLFTFFFVQLLLRLIINTFLLKRIAIKKIIVYDITISVFLFIVCFNKLILFIR